VNSTGKNSVVNRLKNAVLWLEVGTTNNVPRVIASIYITCVKLGGNSNKLIVSELGLALTSDISVVICRGTMYPEVWLWHR